MKDGPMTELVRTGEDAFIDGVDLIFTVPETHLMLST